jgi:hypothetical protein
MNHRRVSAFARAVKLNSAIMQISGWVAILTLSAPHWLGCGVHGLAAESQVHAQNKRWRLFGGAVIPFPNTLAE